MVKKAVKKQLIAGLDPAELVLLKFSKTAAQTSLSWEHASEFEYQGQMFDVVATEEKGDSVFYRCWLDHEETVLNKKLTEMVSGLWENHPTKSEGQQQLLDLFQSFYFPTQQTWALKPIDFQKIRPMMVYSFNLPSRAETPPAPPPQMG